MAWDHTSRPLLPPPPSNQNRREAWQSCPQRALYPVSCLDARWALAWREFVSLVNVIKVFHVKTRSINRPFLGWSQRSKHPAFQRGADASLSRENHTLSSRIRGPRPRTLSKGALAFPAPGRTLPRSASHLPRAQSWARGPPAQEHAMAPPLCSRHGQAGRGRTHPVLLGQIVTGAQFPTPPSCHSWVVYGCLGAASGELRSCYKA